VGQSLHGALSTFGFSFFQDFLEMFQTGLAPLISLCPMLDATAKRFLKDSRPNANGKCEPGIASPIGSKSILTTLHLMQLALFFVSSQEPTELTPGVFSSTSNKCGRKQEPNLTTDRCTGA
jgi:hypothetical protein